jgi:hypothetical protein
VVPWVLTRDDGSRTSPRTVVEIAWDPRVVSGWTRALQFWCGAVSRRSDVPPEMVETRRLELLTLSLQRRCSAN